MPISQSDLREIIEESERNHSGIIAKSYEHVAESYEVVEEPYAITAKSYKNVTSS